MYRKTTPPRWTLATILREMSDEGGPLGHAVTESETEYRLPSMTLNTHSFQFIS